MIPRILHHCWLADRPEDIPGKFLQACRRHTVSMHPMWEATEHTTPDLLAHEAFAHIAGPLRSAWYRFAGQPTARSDLYRLMALYVHGGVYCDHDVWAIRPFDDLLNRDLLLAVDRMEPLLVGEHVIGSVARNPNLMKIIWRMVFSHPSKEGKYSPRLTRWVIESGLHGPAWMTMMPQVFCPAPRIVDTEDEAYRIFPQTHALHCWCRYPNGRDVEYDADRLREITEGACLAI